MRKVIDGPIGDELLARISSNPNTRLVALCWMDAGTRNVYSNKPIKAPADLKGMKIRMMGNPIFVETMNAMGGNGVAMGFDQLFSALQTGVVDGAENNPPTLLAQNHNQVSKVYSLTGHLIIPEILVFSKRTWDTLSKADQDLLRKVAREAQTEERGLWDKMVAESTQKLKAAGMQFGVFMRYAMNSAASWPEPLAGLLMVLCSFVGGAAVYRANLHMAVVAFLEAVNKKTRKALLALVDLCMLATALFMLGYGAHL